MRILFFGDYSNLHACLATELRRRGHEVCVVSDGGRYLNTEADILLDRAPGKLNSFRYLYQVSNLISRLKNFDVVQIINPNFLNLRPGKIKYFYDTLRQQNGSMFLTLAGNDYHFCKECLEGDKFRFSEFRIGDKLSDFELNTSKGRSWLTQDNARLSEHIYATIDGAMSVLPEYDMASRPFLGERLVFTNIPVDLSYLPFTPLDISGKITLFIGIRKDMKEQKGTGILLDIATRLSREMPELCEVKCVSNLPLKEYLGSMSNSHIVLDQLYAYSPATNALQAMALGKVAASGAQPEYYNYISAGDTRPVVELSPLTDIEETLRQLILDKEVLPKMGAQGRAIVETNNDLGSVADRFENHWNKILQSR